MKVQAASLLLLLAAGLFAAGEKPNCDDPKGGYEETECAHIRFKKADQALNDAYKALKAKLGKEQAKLLVAAQKGWLQLRDNQCALQEFAGRGTTGYNARYSDCLLELTDLRTKQLEATPTDSSLQ